MKAAGDNIQSAAGKTGDAAADNFDAAKNDARSAVRPILRMLPRVRRHDV